MSSKAPCSKALIWDFVTTLYIYIYISNSENLHIALVYLLSTLIADEVFNSLFYYIIYIYIYIYIYIFFFFF